MKNYDFVNFSRPLYLSKKAKEIYQQPNQNNINQDNLSLRKKQMLKKLTQTTPITHLQDFSELSKQLKNKQEIERFLQQQTLPKHQQNYSMENQTTIKSYPLKFQPNKLVSLKDIELEKLNSKTQIEKEYEKQLKKLKCTIQQEKDLQFLKQFHKLQICWQKKRFVYKNQIKQKQNQISNLLLQKIKAIEIQKQKQIYQLKHQILNGRSFNM